MPPGPALEEDTHRERLLNTVQEYSCEIAPWYSEPRWRDGPEAVRKKLNSGSQARWQQCADQLWFMSL